MKNVQQAAKTVQSKGRGYDSVLVHMTPEELQGLQSFAAQHGGSLTKNPKTGLYEAGFLSGIMQLLPIAASVAGSMYGMPWLGPVVGAASGLMQGKGLLGAGLGAAAGWGASSLAGKFIDPAVAEGVGEALSAEENQSIFGGLNYTPNPDVMEQLANNYGAPADDSLWPTPESQRPQGAAFQEDAALNAPFAAPPAFASSPADSLWTPPTPRGAWDRFSSGMGRMGSSLVEDPKSFLRTNALPLAAAGIGTMGLMSNNRGNNQPAQAPYSRPPQPRYDARSGRFVYPGEPGFAGGGIAGLMGYAEGGGPRLMEGPGDGVSDSIPARINGSQPAALADGEFVIPARTVSELGNGSTKAGAKQLYAMIDRVQQARRGTVGKGRVAKRNNPAKLMPA